MVNDTKLENITVPTGSKESGYDTKQENAVISVTSEIKPIELDKSVNNITSV